MNDVSIHCPIAYGSIAFWLGKKAEETQTHRWTLFVRGPNGKALIPTSSAPLLASRFCYSGEDISYFVSKVVFFLHESFAQPVRTVTEPPFELSENGWGEFDW
jgi:YEATS domain-containing protein 4